MRQALVALLLVWPSWMQAATVQNFSDEDYKKALRETSRVLFYSVSPAMPLSVDGLKEIRSAAADLHAELVLLADPAATQKEVESLGDSGIRIQESTQLRNLGIQLHYPSVLVSNNHQVTNPPIAGFKTREAYVALVADMLKLQWKEEFQITQQVPLPRPMSPFFKPIYGTDLVISGNAGPNFLLNLHTGRVFDIPNDDWGDPGASPDGEFVTLLGFGGLAWFSTADILAGKSTRLLKDPGLKTYQSMGQRPSGIHRVIGAISSSTNPAGLIVRDHEKRRGEDDKPTVFPITEWRTFCDRKVIAIPMLSKTGLYLSGTHEGTTKVFRIGPNATECEEVFNTNVISGKADFSADDRFIVYVSRTENPNSHLDADAVFLADLEHHRTKAIYYGPGQNQLAFPAFMNPDRIVVYDQTARQLVVIERTRRIEE